MHTIEDTLETCQATGGFTVTLSYNTDQYTMLRRKKTDKKMQQEKSGAKIQERQKVSLENRRVTTMILVCLQMHNVTIYFGEITFTFIFTMSTKGRNFFQNLFGQTNQFEC